jgi:hypothetical protein
MKTVTPRLRAHGTTTGIEVKPTVALLPLRLTVARGDHTGALQALRSRADAVAAAAAPAEVTLHGFEARTSKVAGSALFGRGVRHDATATGTLRLPLDPRADWLARVTAVQALRERVHGLEDAELTVGVAKWIVEDPESHREALLARLAERIRVTETALGLVLDGVELGSDLHVDVQGPALAVITLSAGLKLSRA